MGYVLRVCLTIGPIAKRKKMPALGYFKDTAKLKTQALTKSLNVDIWEVGTSNQFIKKGSYTDITFSKKKIIYWQNFDFCDSPFCTPSSLLKKLFVFLKN